MKMSIKSPRKAESIGGASKSAGERLVVGRPRIPMLRQKIMGSAIDLFAEKGFDRVSIDEIAARASVGKGSVYRQFSSKEELYTVAVIEGYIDLRRRIVSALKDAASVPEAVTMIVSQIVSYFWNRLDFFELLRNPIELSRGHEKRYRRERQKLAGIIGTVLARGVKSGAIRGDLDRQLLVESLLGMIRGIQRYNRGAAGSLSQEQVVRTVVSVFFDGCSTRSAIFPAYPHAPKTP